MAMDNGCNFHVGGAYEYNAETPTDSGLVASNGLVTSERISSGIVELTLNVPCNGDNMSCQVTQRGTPGFYFLGVEHVSNTKKRVHTVEYNDDGPEPADINFDFLFVKFGQPQQGLR